MHAAGLRAAGRRRHRRRRLLRRRRLARRVPRAPYTLAVIAAARMLDAFAGLSVLPPRVRDRRIAAATRGRSYGLGWTCGTDGVHRVGVDEEELDGDQHPATSKHAAGRWLLSG